MTPKLCCYDKTRHHYLLKLEVAKCDIKFSYDSVN